MKKEKSESQETPDDENKESIETQSKEQEEGTEQHSQHIVSEEFQREVLNLVKEYKDSKPCLEFGYRAFSDAQEDLRKREREKEMKGKKHPEEFSTAEMPSY